VGLRGIFGIVAFAMKGIFGNRRSKHSLFAIDNGDANAECPEVNTCHNRHQQSPPLASTNTLATTTAKNTGR
jgi:hypothetical protein